MRYLTTFLVSLLIIITTALTVNFGFSKAEAFDGLSLGDLVKTADSTAVYFIGQNSRRFVFPDRTTYLSWYDDFSQVKTITVEELASYRIGGNVTMRPGTFLVKIQSDPKTYAVEPGGVLRWVISETVALELYGPDWAQRVRDVSVSFFANYDDNGEAIENADYPDGSLIRNQSSGIRYLVKKEVGGNLCAVVVNNFSEYGFSNRDFIITTKIYPACSDDSQSTDDYRYLQKAVISGAQCQTGDVKNYLCASEDEVYWCDCKAGQWVCIFTPYSQCPCTDKDEDGFGVELTTNCPKYGRDCDDSRFMINPDQEEMCYDNRDNNCNNRTDENCVCTDGETKECGPDYETGICRTGAKTCYDNKWSSCVGAVYPEKEICDDNLDNDCDGQIDEGCNYCSDTTEYNKCADDKPKYCSQGEIIDKCSFCGCPIGRTCQTDGSCSY